MSGHSGIVSSLNELNIDAFLLTDFRGRDPYARRILELPEDKIYSRRWFVVFHRDGTVKTVTHRIEPSALESIQKQLPGSVNFSYSSRIELQSALKAAFKGAKCVAACYSKEAELPIISTIDAGTLELVQQTGIKVISGAELLQHSFCKLQPESYNQHLKAGAEIDRIRQEAFEFIGATVGTSSLREYDVVGFILSKFQAAGLYTDHPPCVAVNSNSALPHYEPDPVNSTIINKGDFVLIDLWAKFNAPDAIYYDITWCGVLREFVIEEEEVVFNLVRVARDAGVNFVKKRVAESEKLYGFEVDRHVREVITKGGFEKYFIHRTGHSIGYSVHGEGANLDDFETHDSREILVESCFSIEPGIYLEKFGVRSELNMFIRPRKAVVTGDIQHEIIKISCK